jgi:hypothetical protein
LLGSNNEILGKPSLSAANSDYRPLGRGIGAALSAFDKSAFDDKWPAAGLFFVYFRQFRRFTPTFRVYADIPRTFSDAPGKRRSLTRIHAAKAASQRTRAAASSSVD